MDRFHVHQVQDLLASLMGRAGTLCDQLLVIPYPDLPSVAADDQIIVPSSLIGKLDVKAQVLVHGLFKVDLAHVIPPGGHVFEIQGPVVPILYLICDL